MQIIYPTIFFILLFSFGCRPDIIPEDYDLDGLLLYQEIHSNHTQGFFLDLTAYNPNTEERFLLTRETLFNIHPSWVEGGDFIIFESKRVRDHGSPSHLYVLNTRTTRIFSLHGRVDLNRLTGGFTQYHRPAVNNKYNRVYYYGTKCGCIMSTDLNSLSMDRMDIQIDGTNRIRWSNDYEYLIVHETVGRGNVRQVKFMVYKFESFDSYEEVITKERTGWTYLPADIYDNNLLYAVKQRVSGAVLSLKMLNIETGIETEIANYDRNDNNNLASFRTPIFKDDQTIYYLKEVTPNTYEVFEMDINSGVSKQITNDNTYKANLTIYRD